MKQPLPDNIKLYNHVAEVRLATGWKQSVLAYKVGISRSTLIRIERGEVIPSIYVALRLSDFLGVPIEELFSLEETEFLTAEQAFNREALAKLPPELRRIYEE